MKTIIKIKVFIGVMLMILFPVSDISAQIKVHDDGQISFQSLTKTDGVQIDLVGRASFEPNLTNEYARLVQTKALTNYVKSWIVKKVTGPLYESEDVFYVMGNGDVYSGNHYVVGHEQEARNGIPIEDASSILSSLTGYYFESHEHDGLNPDFADNPDVLPEAVNGLIQDLNISRSLALSTDELEKVLPEAIRHEPEGRRGINYNAIVPLLVEAFKEQQARIEHMEALLRENGLLER